MSLTDLIKHSRGIGPKEVGTGIYLVLLSIFLAAAPAVSVEHDLVHLEEQYHVADVSEWPGGALPTDSDADFEAQCDLCGSLNSDRLVFGEAHPGLSMVVEALGPVFFATSDFVPRALGYAPESQRAPPIS